MYGKQLLNGLAQYIRRLWPYILALMAMSVFARLIVTFDKNPIEATGTMTAIGLLVMTALVFVAAVLIHAYKSFLNNLAMTDAEKLRPKRFIWTHAATFMINLIVTMLLLVAGAAILVWNNSWELFSAFDTDWYYYVEFLFYIVILAFTIYIVPIAYIVATRFNRRKTLAMIVGVFTFILCIGSISSEAALLIHSPDTDMLFAWEFTAMLFVIFIVVDVCMYVMTYRTLKLGSNNAPQADL